MFNKAKGRGTLSIWALEPDGDGPVATGLVKTKRSAVEEATEVLLLVNPDPWLLVVYRILVPSLASAILPAASIAPCVHLGQGGQGALVDAAELLTAANTVQD